MLEGGVLAPANLKACCNQHRGDGGGHNARREPPGKLETPVTMNCPMTLVFALRLIIRTITGTATTPLMTADQ
jgi:hypothetical protein